MRFGRHLGSDRHSSAPKTGLTPPYALLVVVAVHRVTDLAGCCGKKPEPPRDPASVPDLRQPRVLLSRVVR